MVQIYSQWHTQTKSSIEVRNESEKISCAYVFRYFAAIGFCLCWRRGASANTHAYSNSDSKSDTNSHTNPSSYSYSKGEDSGGELLLGTGGSTRKGHNLLYCL